MCLPVYLLGHGEPRERRALVGLDAETLEPVWRWPHSNYIVDETGLCRYDEQGMLHLVELPSLYERRIQGPFRPHAGFDGHFHYGDLWCHFFDRERVGISTVTGEVAWRHTESAAGFHDRGALSGHVAFFGNRGVSAYDLRTGELLWRQPLGGRVMNCNPRIADTRLYVATGDGCVHVLDRSSGDVLASHAVKEDAMAVVPLVPNRVVIGTYELLYCLELA
jgi:outer membrane protein assembly factor BamB